MGFSWAAARSEAVSFVRQFDALPADVRSLLGGEFGFKDLLEGDTLERAQKWFLKSRAARSEEADFIVPVIELANHGAGGLTAALVSQESAAAAASSPEAPDVLIVDPPRTGISREALDGVIRLRAPKIVYVSCDVATLARDSKRLVDAGYRIEQASAFDLFPNTPHVETVISFGR